VPPTGPRHHRRDRAEDKHHHDSAFGRWSMQAVGDDHTPADGHAPRPRVARSWRRTSVPEVVKTKRGPTRQRLPGRPTSTTPTAPGEPCPDRRRFSPLWTPGRPGRMTRSGLATTGWCPGSGPARWADVYSQTPTAAPSCPCPFFPAVHDHKAYLGAMARTPSTASPHGVVRCARYCRGAGQARGCGPPNVVDPAGLL
jgi:hypothetical protein